MAVLGGGVFSCERGSSVPAVSKGTGVPKPRPLSDLIRLCVLIPQKVFITLFCKSQLPQKSVDLSFIIIDTKNEMMASCGNSLLENDCMNTF